MICCSDLHFEAEEREINKYQGEIKGKGGGKELTASPCAPITRLGLFTTASAILLSINSRFFSTLNHSSSYPNSVILLAISYACRSLSSFEGFGASAGRDIPLVVSLTNSGSPWGALVAVAASIACGIVNGREGVRRICWRMKPSRGLRQNRSLQSELVKERRETVPYLP